MRMVEGLIARHWTLLATLNGIVLIACLLGLCLIFLAVMPLRDRKRKAKPIIASATGHSAMAELVQIQNASGAKLFAISGTLLGIHRDGDIIEHDDDLDFGIFDDDPHLVDFFRMMQASPSFKLEKKFRLSWLGRQMNSWIPALPQDTLLHKYKFIGDGTSSERLDIFVHFQPSPGIIAHGSTRSQWLNSAFALETIEHKELKLFVPTNRSQYLRENYGVWEIAIRDFESSLDCPNHYPMLTVSAAALLAWKLVKFTLRGNNHRSSALRARTFRFIKMCLVPKANIKLPDALCDI